MPPNAPAPNAPIAGPSSRPPICAAAVQPERLAASLRRRRVGQVAARRRVVHRGREAGEAAQDDERERPGQDQRQRAEERRSATRPRTISGTRAVRSASQPKIGSLTRRAIGQAAMTMPSVARSMPCSVKYSGQDRQEAAEPEPHDEFGGQQRQDAAPAVEPGGEAGADGEAERGRSCGVRSASVPGARRHVGPGARGRARQDEPVYCGVPRVPTSGGRRMAAIDGRGPGQDLQDPQERGPRPRRGRPDRRGGHRPRPARPERRRQDDDRAHPGHAAQAGRRPGHGRRLRRRPAGPAAPPRHRPVRPVRRGRREPDRPREPVDVRPAVPAAIRRGARRAPTSCSSSSTSSMPRDRVVKTYSGGMRRRLDLGSALIGRPRLLFLDEPTTGLDPRSRLGHVGRHPGLVREGTTLLLTTQYLEEADELADTIAVVDHGKIIARGHGRRAQVAGRRRADRGRRPRPDADRRGAPRSSAGIGVGDGRRSTSTPGALTVPAEGGAPTLVRWSATSARRASTIDDIGLRRPTLDDVFLSLTGHAVGRGRPTEEPRHDGRTTAPPHRASGALGQAVRDGLVVTWRNLKRIPRIPELAIFAILQSIMFVLLFAFVFGGAILIPGYGQPERLPRVPDARDLRPDDRVRRRHHGDRHDRRRRQGHHRPLPLAADGALRRASPVARWPTSSTTPAS